MGILLWDEDDAPTQGDLLAAFEHTSAPVAVLRGAGVTAFPSTAYRLLHEVGDGYVGGWSIVLDGLNHNLSGPISYYLTESSNAGTAASPGDGFAYTPGTGWTNVSGTAYFDGTATYSSTAGNTCTWTTPSGVTEAWAMYLELNTCGMSLVTIDGSATAATSLPTAQQLVDLGTLASSALVANGGTLNPTDRILDQYGSAPVYRKTKELVTGLSADQHVIALINTAYRNVSATGNRMYVDGMLYRTSTTSLGSSRAYIESATDMAPDSVYEYALSVRPRGSGTYTYVGNGHGNETDSTFTIQVDGVDYSPAESELKSGTTVGATKTSTITHPDAVGNIATSEVSWSLAAVGGLTVSCELTWLQDLDASDTYTAMCPVPDAYSDRGSVWGSQTDATLSSSDQSQHCNTQSATSYQWLATGVWGFLLHVPDLTAAVDDWAGTNTDYHWIQDRTGGLLNKAYVNRFYGPGKAIDTDDVWTWTINYRLQRFPSGADSALAEFWR
jgi:hypothetical protein